MTDSQPIYVNVHDPRVERVGRLSGSGTLTVRLGDGNYHGAIVLFTSAEEWRRINADVEVFLENELREKTA